MTLALDHLSACFEGVIPSVVATTAADGMPNVSYLSHVVKVDENRVALSNQFFAKTAANVRANRQTALLVVCPRTGDQYLLDMVWETLVDHGPVFDHIDRALKAAIAQTGMANVMRLRAVDIFRVEAVHPVPSALLRNEVPAPPVGPTMRDLSTMIGRISDQSAAEALFDMLMECALTLTKATNALVLLHEPESATLLTVASIGYDDPGSGSEVGVGEGLIGQVAAGHATLKINDLSRMRRMGQAVAGAAAAAENARIIALPQLPGAQSQIAVPMISQGKLVGVLFLESERRLAFDDEAAAGLEALARQAAISLPLVESPASQTVEIVPQTATTLTEAIIAVKVHRFDDSVFIDDRYVIKGVAGRLLVFLIERALAEGRTTFTNREIRRASELRLPEFKDNLESRLLLLARRLEEKAFPIQLIRRERGVMELAMTGDPKIEFLS